MKKSNTQSRNPKWLSRILSIVTGVLFFSIGTIYSIDNISEYIEQKGINFSFHLLDIVIILLFAILCSILAKYSFDLFTKINRIIVYIISLPLLLVSSLSLLAFLFFIATVDLDFSKGLCGEKIIKEISSPDNNLKAVIFLRDCGATTSFITHVVVIPNNSSLSDLSLRNRPSIFSADCNHGQAPFGKGGGSEVNLSWISNDKIEIQHNKLDRVHLQHSMSKGVLVQYKDFE